MPRVKMQRGTAKSAYMYAVAYLDNGRPFTAEELAPKIGVNLVQARNAINYIVSLPSQYPGFERIGRGIFRYTGPGLFGDSDPSRPTLMSVPEPTLAPAGHPLLMVKVLAEVDGRRLVMDEDTNAVYWMEAVA